MNNEEYIKVAEENILDNKFMNNIKIVNNDILNIDNNLINHFNIVVSNPPFHNKKSNKSNNKFKDVAKRIIDFEKWMEGCVKLLKDKGTLFIIIPTDAIKIATQTLSDIFSFKNKKPNNAVKKGMAAKHSKVTAALVFVIE